MKKRATLLTAVLTILVVASATFFLRAPVSNNAWITIKGVPSSMRIEGEIVAQGKLQPLQTEYKKNGTVLLKNQNRPDAVSIRLMDSTANVFYDIEYAQSIFLKGFAANTRLTLASENEKIYQNLPTDWNGRLTLPVQKSRPLELSFTQNGQDFTISFPPMTGGEA